VDKSNIIGQLRPKIENLLSDAEARTGLGVVFESLPSTSHVVSKYGFDTGTNTPTVFLRSDWQDVDLAHELMHMWLELVEGYYVLAWRQNVDRTQEIEAAFSRIRDYVDDEVVHARLIQLDLILDGEVLKPPQFDDIFTRVPRLLNKLRLRGQDGMDHLDSFGRGELCRSSFLVRAELIRQTYSEQLPHDRLKRVERFIEAFRTHRSSEASKADEVLALFRSHDVQSISGHKEILWEWAKMEQLDRFVGPSSYRRENGRFILPWP
jgi:hypothetical protein